MHIGLLEESPAIAELLSTTLCMDGHTVGVHVSASSLLEHTGAGSSVQAARRAYDLLILDVLIDEPSERALLAKLDCTLSEHFPLLVITASHADQVDQARRAHPNISFLPKPFHLVILLSTIARQAAQSTETLTTN